MRIEQRRFMATGCLARPVL